MNKTLFAGLTALDAGESLSEDGFSFQAVNPYIIDALLQVGAVTHRHDAHDALANPVAAASAVALASGGSLPGDTTYYFGYTLVDADGGETALSPAVSVTTPAQLAEPTNSPTLTADYTAGSLSVGTYYYAVTWTDASGGETTLGGYNVIDREPGAASGRILVSGLSTGIVAAGGTGWKLYRASNGGLFRYLTSGTTAQDSVYDDGTLCADCEEPPDTNTTAQTASIQITLPPLPAGSASWKLYGSDSGVFNNPSYMASGVASGTTTLTTFYPESGSPPPVSRALRGAAKINASTDITNWPSDRVGHSFALTGEINVASGATDYIPPFFVVLPATASGAVTRARHKIYSGTSATVKLTKNGSDLTGFTGISVTTTSTTTSGSASVADGDLLALVVTAVSGTPTHLSFTITLQIDRS